VSRAVNNSFVAAPWWWAGFVRCTNLPLQDCLAAMGKCPWHHPSWPNASVNPRMYVRNCKYSTNAIHGFGWALWNPSG
jgi:hypothetical protein